MSELLTQSPVIVPHFSLPFRFVNQGGGALTAAVTEQDSEEEIRDCVLAVLLYTPESRPEKPDFGTPDQTFASPRVDTAAIYSAISRWEPRAAYRITEGIDTLDALIARVRAEINYEGLGGSSA